MANFLAEKQFKLPATSAELAFPGLLSQPPALLDVRVSKIEEILRGMYNQSAGSLEAFGVKVPARIVREWGIIAIITTQFYFLLHALSLLGALRKHPSPVHFAWIALYQNNLSKFSTHLSASILPIASTASVTYSALLISRSLAVAWLPIIGTTASIVLGIWLSFILFKLARNFKDGPLPKLSRRS